jgi:hypothetical protein
VREGDVVASLIVVESLRRGEGGGHLPLLIERERREGGGD